MNEEKTEAARMQLIKSAYGRVWEVLEPFHHYNGLIKVDAVIQDDSDAHAVWSDLDDAGVLEFIPGEEDPQMYFRLKSLGGIDNNNGWTNIFSERDMPRAPGNYRFIKFEKGIIKHTTFADDAYLKKFGHWLYEYHQFTHYERVNNLSPLF